MHVTVFSRFIIACVLCVCYKAAWTTSTTAVPASTPITGRTSCGKPNRVYTSCAPSCKQANITCEDLRGQRNCAALPDEPCRGSCVCVEGFYENENEECVPENYCYKCKKSNEVFACGPACDSECSSIGKPCDIVNKKCSEKCYCRKGYARDSNGECIRYSQCPGVPTCNRDQNEEYSCHRTCPPKTCSSIYSLYDCRDKTECEFKCDCKDELLRNNNGVCVSRETCHKELVASVNP